jgi:hypothetical protein
MPELIRNFIDGKMNKDLDERLVPDGQYRDALNLEVSSSEGSNIGALQTILGNTQVQDLSSHLTDAVCIGSVASNEAGKIYWFIASTSKDIIAESDGSTITPVIVDTGFNLKFNANNLITGVSYLDGVLYFTDDSREPKQVNVDYWKSKTSGWSNTSEGLSEDRISLYKKAPLNAPVFESLDQSLRGGNGTHGGNEVYKSMPISDGLSIGETMNTYWADGFYEDDGTTHITPNWQLNDIIEFSRQYTTFDGEETNSKLRFEITSVTATQLTLTLVTMSGVHAPGTYLYKTTLEEIEPIFKLKFPKFAYRFKYTNGQFSTISPFSLPGFIPGDYEYNSKKGFNTGMVNNVRKIELTGWPAYSAFGTYTQDIKEVEVLYKESNDNNLYIVESLPFENSSNGARTISLTTAGTGYSDGIKSVTGGTGSGLKVKVVTINSSLYLVEIAEAGEGYTSGDVVTVRSELWAGNLGTITIDSVGDSTKCSSFIKINDKQVLKAIPGSQILRPYDAIPKKAKALDITANRLVFANYEHNFDVVGNPVFTVTSVNRTNDQQVAQNLSIKSDRSYQLGVVYQDEYGRQTPVFTDTSGILNIETNEATLKSCIQVSATHSSLPNDIKYFKYFIKETSNPYYNLPISSVYTDSETGNMYVSVHSSEVNKVSEEDVLVIKKQSGNTAYSTQNNRFKVISKLSNPPEFLAYKDEVTYATEYLAFGLGYDYDFPGIQEVKKPGHTPVPGHNTVFIQHGGRFADDDISGTHVDPGFVQNITIGSEIQFRRAGTSLLSKTYKIKHIEYGTASQTELEITFEKQFGNDVNILYLDESDSAEIAKTNIEKVEKIEDVGNSEYTGKFFIQLDNEAELKEALYGENDTGNLNTIATNSKIHKSNLSGNTSADFDIRQYFVEHIDWSGNTLPAITSINGAAVNIDAGYHMVITTENFYGDARDKYNTDPFNISFVKGNYIRFSGVWGTWYNPVAYDLAENNANYKVQEVSSNIFTDGSGSRKYWAIKFTEGIIAPWDSAYQSTIDNNGGDYCIDVRSFVSDKAFTPKNPALFEVEAKDGALDIYYETEKTYLKSEMSSSIKLDYANCFSFGNGAESDRIRDDFNASTLGKGVKASAVFDDNYEEERVKNGLIFSQIYNGEAGINRLNQFTIAEDITKSLNPTYGSIQKLHSRNTDLIALCENKCLKILANKDALFNADGNTNVTATRNVLGQAVPFAGEFGISKNPESFATYGFRSYFTDKNNGVVLRLSLDGLTEISAKGMTDFFSDKLETATQLIGSYDTDKNSYNLTIKGPEDNTVSFKENVSGWSSRKSFIPESGVSLGSTYYTFKEGDLWEHNSSSTINNFYGNQYYSSLTMLFNASPGSSKGFKTLNYTGSKSVKYNNSKDAIIENGWWTENIQTDLQKGKIPYFVNKENKWFNFIKGNESTVDTSSLSVQGIGSPNSATQNGAVLTLQFSYIVNESLQVGDVLYFGTTTISEIGAVDSITISNGVTSVVCNTITNLPTVSDFILFSKPTGPNLTSLTGYYAEVEMRNNNSSEISELFSLGTEIFESSN